MEVVKALVKCITDNCEPFIKNGEVHTAVRAKNDSKNRFWGIYIPELMDEPGTYGFRTEDFEVIRIIEE